MKEKQVCFWIKFNPLIKNRKNYFACGNRDDLQLF